MADHRYDGNPGVWRTSCQSYDTSNERYELLHLRCSIDPWYLKLSTKTLAGYCSLYCISLSMQNYQHGLGLYRVSLLSFFCIAALRFEYVLLSAYYSSDQSRLILFVDSYAEVWMFSFKHQYKYASKVNTKRAG